MMLYLIAGMAVLVSIIIALIFKNRADNKSHEAEKQKIIADAVTLKNDHRDQLDTKLEKLHEVQRNETVIERSQLNRRSDFDNDWSNGVSGAGYVAPNSGATATGQTGVTSHQIERADLSD